jgi:hypothetical protein
VTDHAAPLPCLDYVVVEVGGLEGIGGLRVTLAEGERIAKLVEDAIVDTLVFHDISGSKCVYPMRAFHGMYWSTMEQRRHGTAHQLAVEKAKAEMEADLGVVPGLDA